jgi:hypothetical protein
MKITLLRFLTPLVIFFCIDLYAFQGLKTISENLAETQKRWLYIAYWSVTAIVFGLFIYGLFFPYYTWPKALRTYAFGI